MKSAKLQERLHPLIQRGADLITTIDQLADAGVGERTGDTLHAAAYALEAANRLLVLAFEDCADKDVCP